MDVFLLVSVVFPRVQSQVLFCLSRVYERVFSGNMASHFVVLICYITFVSGTNCAPYMKHISYFVNCFYVDVRHTRVSTVCYIIKLTLLYMPDIVAGGEGYFKK